MTPNSRSCPNCCQGLEKAPKPKDLVAFSVPRLSWSQMAKTQGFRGLPGPWSKLVTEMTPTDQFWTKSHSSTRNEDVAQMVANGAKRRPKPGVQWSSRARRRPWLEFVTKMSRKDTNVEQLAKLETIAKRVQFVQVAPNDVKSQGFSGLPPDRALGSSWAQKCRQKWPKLPKLSPGPPKGTKT